jgi:hypothetical protein
MPADTWLEVMTRLVFAQFGLFDDGGPAVLAVRLIALGYILLSSFTIAAAIARCREE